jgi:hypothetical protein
MSARTPTNALGERIDQQYGCRYDPNHHAHSPEAPANGRTPEHGHPEGCETYGHWKEPYTEQRVEYPLSRLPHAIKDLPDRVHELSWTHEVKETRRWQPVTVAMVGPHCQCGMSHPIRRSPGAFCRNFQALAGGQIPEVTYARNGRRRHAGSGPVRG